MPALTESRTRHGASFTESARGCYRRCKGLLQKVAVTEGARGCYRRWLLQKVQGAVTEGGCYRRCKGLLQKVAVTEGARGCYRRWLLQKVQGAVTEGGRGCYRRWKGLLQKVAVTEGGRGCYRRWLLQKVEGAVTEGARGCYRRCKGLFHACRELHWSLSPSVLVGLVVKATASRAEDPGFEFRLRRDFFGFESYKVTQTLALRWLPCQAPGVIGPALGLVGPVSVYCDWVTWKVWSATSVSVWQRVKLSEQIRP